MFDYPRVRITDCPHQAIHEELEGYLLREHDDHTGTIIIDANTVCRANSWKALKKAPARKTAKAPSNPKTATVQYTPKGAGLSIKQTDEDNYTLSYTSRYGERSLEASNITIQELEMALNAVQMLQSSQ